MRSLSATAAIWTILMVFMASYAHSIVLIGTNGGHYNLNLAADQLQIAISCMYVYQASNNDTCFSVAYAFEMSGSGTYNIMFTYYGNGEYTDPSAFMCGKSGYASQMPSDPTQIIAISQQLGLKLFSSYMTSDEINNFESFAGPMCMSQLEITAGGTTFTKVIYDVCDDTNGCATNDIDFWDPSGVDAVCSGASGACHTSAYLNPIWMG
ncbi:hypothetical protein HDU82_003200 [Entophlyctis luteolus]|nr:hypothetical protein HDU82_003200 [Entophlyctis luteolus]